jgi:hypothetical protein
MLADGHHKGLIAVITRAEISIFKGFRHGYLGKFLSIAKNSEFCLACKYLFTARINWPGGFGRLFYNPQLQIV